MRQGRALLVGTLLVAIVVAILTGAILLVVEPTLSKAEMVKTGGLAGGAVVALYALWLNDRRRRTEEARHELETAKAADERFARSVELLGSEADQVRVGGMHALAWLARSTHRYKQTVIDVLCAYLRRPFAEDGSDADREHQVRLTAQRLVSDLLPRGQNPDPIRYDLDLTGASLEHFRLESTRIGRLTARNAQFRGITRLGELQVSKPALFTGAVFHGRVSVRDARFDGGISFQDTSFADEVAWWGASTGTFLDLNTTAPQRQLGTFTVAAGTVVRGAVEGWAFEGKVLPDPAGAS